MDSTEIRIFENEEFGTIRTVIIDGEPWFALKDVCGILGLTTPARVAERLDEDEVTLTHLTDSLGRAQETTIVNESGLYNVILRSDKPKAKPFRKWVTSDVLPTIRKHGAYMSAEVIEQTLNDPDFIIQLATSLKEERQARKLAEDTIKEQKPLVDFAIHVTQSSDTVDVGEFAKIVKNENINIGRNRLFEWLRRNGYLMNGNTPYQKYIENGLFEVVETTKATVYGTKIFPKTVITGKGQAFLIEKLRHEFN